MKIGIVGLGLMGGSFGRTLTKKTSHKVFGFDINKNVMLKGEMIGAYHQELTVENAKELDLLIISVFEDAFSSCVEQFLPYLKKGAIVCDFCGIKRRIVAKMQEYAKNYTDIIFIGGHPMAGREFSGIEHSTTTLFDKASMILCPVNADIYTLESFKRFFLDLGFSDVVFTDSQNHDKMIAYTSQLCHIVSNAFIKNDTAKEHFGYSAGSYKDLTRVAKLNPKMWSSLMINNKDVLSDELKELIENLNLYLQALEKGDQDMLEKLLSDGNERKLAIDLRGKKSGN